MFISTKSGDLLNTTAIERFEKETDADGRKHWYAIDREGRRFAVYESKSSTLRGVDPSRLATSLKSREWGQVIERMRKALKDRK